MQAGEAAQLPKILIKQTFRSLVHVISFDYEKLLASIEPCHNQSKFLHHSEAVIVYLSDMNNCTCKHLRLCCSPSPAGFQVPASEGSQRPDCWSHCTSSSP